MSIRTADIVQNRFSWRPFEKWPKPYLFGNLAYIIPRSPLNKMVPLLESSEGGRGGGCTVTNSRPWDSCVYMTIYSLFSTLKNDFFVFFIQDK